MNLFIKSDSIKSTLKQVFQNCARVLERRDSRELSSFNAARGQLPKFV